MSMLNGTIVDAAGRMRAQSMDYDVEITLAEGHVAAQPYVWTTHCDQKINCFRSALDTIVQHAVHAHVLASELLTGS